MGLCVSRDLGEFKTIYKERYLVFYQLTQIDLPSVEKHSSLPMKEPNPLPMEEPNPLHIEEPVKERAQNRSVLKSSLLMGPNASGRYLRTAQGSFPAPPSLASYKESPYKMRPKESPSIIKEDIKYDSKLRTPGRLVPLDRDQRFVNVEKSANLGDLEKYAQDTAMYHPDMYDEDDDPTNKPNPNILGEDVQGKGVFDTGEAYYNNKNSMKGSGRANNYER